MVLVAVVAFAMGILTEKWLRARRDIRATKTALSLLRQYFWMILTPRFLILGFITGCAAVAVLRVYVGQAE